MFKSLALFAVLAILFQLTDGETFFQINYKLFTNPNTPELPGGFSCIYTVNDDYKDKCSTCHVKFTTFIPFLK